MDEIIRKHYEMKLLWNCKRLMNKNGKIEEIYVQPERLNPEDKNWFGMKAEMRDGLCYFEDGTIIDPSQPIDVCDSPNTSNT